VLIDAANEAGRLIELIGSTPVAPIVTTHRHWDHWQALAEVRAAAGAAVVAHPGDAAELPVPVTDPVRHGERVPVGEVELSVIHLRGAHARHPAHAARPPRRRRWTSGLTRNYASPGQSQCGTSWSGYTSASVSAREFCWATLAPNSTCWRNAWRNGSSSGMPASSSTCM
jgi:hypothetical protein